VLIRHSKQSVTRPTNKLIFLLKHYYMFRYGVNGMFDGHNPSGRIMALRSTQPLTEMSTSNISCVGEGKVGRCVGLTPLSPSCTDCLEIWEPQTPPLTIRACPGLHRDCFTFTFYVFRSTQNMIRPLLQKLSK
jgi:hypothetical protein